MSESIEETATSLVAADGRLVSADPLLARLQHEAGSRVGSQLAVPQLAAVVRLVQKLGVAVSRRALAGTARTDLELWVRAEPSEAGVRLTVERLAENSPQAQRWPDRADGPADDDDWFEVDAELKLGALGQSLARRLGVPAQSVAGTPLTRLLKLEPNEEGELPLLGALAGRKPIHRQSARLQSDLNVTVQLSGDPIVGPNGDFAGFRGRISLPGAADPSAEPTAGFNELLREPVESIIAEAQAIAERTEGPLRSDYAAYASDMAGAARHLLEVLRSAGSETPDAPDRVDLARLAAEAIALVQPQAAARGVALEQAGLGELPARGQGRAVTQILVNLIGNAVRYSPEGGVVQVIVKGDAAASITVADDGPGVATPDRERIFERFEQAEPRGEGSGLGLAISRRLARSLGGDISLDSGQGEGARFTLTLPLS